MKDIRIILIILFFCTHVQSCSNEKDSIAEILTYSEQDVANNWVDLTLYLTQYTPANTPTYASRAIGYIGLTMYESVVHGNEDYTSFAPNLNGIPELPMPNKGKKYNWLATLNAAQAEIIKGVYNQTSDENKLMIDSLEQSIQGYLLTLSTTDVINRSVEYGKSIASAIFQWSKTDGGHRGYLHNFDKEFFYEEIPGSWKPPLFAQSFSHHPLHPYWGDNRTFVSSNSNLDLPSKIAFDTSKTSPYYLQFLEVYEKEKSLTQEEKETALWWGDDPDDTFTPPGHSLFIASIIVKSKNPSLIECANTYARVSMAVADAFINCWKWKYHFFSERPNTFIPKYIDEEWVSFWPDPPFPSFPSGHAIQASACATVLQALYGDNFTFIDSSHVIRDRDEQRDVDFIERHFTAFWDVAKETADSRFYGGIHTHEDNNVGLEEGRRIAERVLALNSKKEN